MATVLDATYSQDACVLTLRTLLNLKQRDFLWTLLGDEYGPATMWVVRSCHGVGHQSNNFKLELGFANASDVDLHSKFEPGAEIWVSGMSENIIDVVTSPHEISFDAQDGLAVSKRFKVAGDVSISDGGLSMISSGGSQNRASLTLADDSLKVSCQEGISLRSRRISIHGEVRGENFDISRQGNSHQNASVAREGFYTTLVQVPIGADPQRTLSQGYDYDVGEFISWIDINVEAPRIRRPDYQ
jgi:hypothetical protein